MDNPKQPAQPRPATADDKKVRLAAALRSNLQRRKSATSAREDKECLPSS